MESTLPIYHFRMPSQYWLTSTFLRLQEFYESPKFAAIAFSFEEFADWYAATASQRSDNYLAKGEFSYYTDWSGFNFPSIIVSSFLAVFSAAGMTLSRKEQWLLSYLSGLQEPFYVIGTYRNPARTSVIDHEVVHALFYLFPTYAAAVNQAVDAFDLSQFKEALLRMGYTKAVLNDEINAYLLTGLVSSLEDCDVSVVDQCRAKLQEEFIAFFPDGIEAIKKKVRVFDGSNIIP